MSATPEPLSAILAEMRRHADQMTPPAVCDLASRIEAAAERERTAPGNAAVLREALENVTVYARSLSRVRNAEVNDDANRILDRARAALATPARNCDRYRTAEEAFRAFHAAHDCSRGGCQPCQFAPDECAVRWLFAPAEGGAE